MQWCLVCFVPGCTILCSSLLVHLNAWGQCVVSVPISPAAPYMTCRRDNRAIPHTLTSTKSTIPTTQRHRAWTYLCTLCGPHSHSETPLHYFNQALNGSSASLSWSKSLLNWFSLWWTYTSSYKDSCRFSLLGAGKSNTVWTFLMFSKTFFLHCTNVYITRQSHPLFYGQRSTNGNNEPFQWNYQRSIINYCPRGGSMGHAASHSTTPHHTQQNTIAFENIVG